MGKRVLSFFFEIAQVLVLAVSIFLFVYLLIMQPHKISGASMEPNFHDNEYLLTDKLSYRFSKPQRGEIVVFKAPPTNYEEEYIKRIIAIPGDTVEIIGDQMYVNGELLNEPYLAAGLRTEPGGFLGRGQIITLPAGAYFMMGDNREHSKDSRHFGFVPEDKITGKAWFVYWPPEDFGVVNASN